MFVTEVLVSCFAFRVSCGGGSINYQLSNNVSEFETGWDWICYDDIRNRGVGIGTWDDILSLGFFVGMVRKTQREDGDVEAMTAVFLSRVQAIVPSVDIVLDTLDILSLVECVPRSL